MLPALALGLLPLQAGAQEQPLPSVSEYHLPTPSPRASRAAGPVDPSNPVVPVKRDEGAAAPAAPVSATASPAPARTAKPSPKPSPSPSASASPSRTAEPRRAEEAAPRKRAEESDRTESRDSPPREADTAKPEGNASPAASPAASTGPVMPPVQWNIHSAKDAESNPIWPWLVGIVVLLASNVLLLVLLLRRRQRKADENFAAEQAALAAERPVAEPMEAPLSQPLSDAPVPQVAAEFDAPAVQTEPAIAPIPAQPMAAPEARPALELVAKPIEVTLAARQLSATLMNAVLHYELVVTNLSEDTVGPIIIAGDMIGAHASLPTRSQLEMTGTDIEPHHRHPVLHPQEWAKFTGEFRLPLAAITPIRSGRASLFIPLARFRVEIMRNGAPPLVINRTFVIGETPETPEAALKPFRLDLGPRLYSQIGQREVAAIA